MYVNRSAEKKVIGWKLRDFYFLKHISILYNWLGRDSEWERDKLALHAGGEDVGFFPLTLPTCEVRNAILCLQEENRSCDLYFHLA